MSIPVQAFLIAFTSVALVTIMFWFARKEIRRQEEKEKECP